MYPRLNVAYASPCSAACCSSSCACRPHQCGAGQTAPRISVQHTRYTTQAHAGTYCTRSCRSRSCACWASAQPERTGRHRISERTGPAVGPIAKWITYNGSTCDGAVYGCVIQLRYAQVLSDSCSVYSCSIRNAPTNCFLPVQTAQRCAIRTAEAERKHTSANGKAAPCGPLVGPTSAIHCEYYTAYSSRVHSACHGTR
jgi:hypothetical protein